MTPSDLQAVILCGGRGTRLGETPDRLPKPLVEIGGEPILLHIMRQYADFGVRRFVLCLGYRGEMIKDYFLNFRWRRSNFRLILGEGPRPLPGAAGTPDWEVDCIDTGLDAMTGARLKRIEPFLSEEIAFLTYGDGVADIDMAALLAFHRNHGRICTVTGVHPPSRFGVLEVEGPRVAQFNEKPQLREGYINGGFFVFDRRLFNYLRDNDDCRLEGDPLERLAADGQLMIHRHDGFWHCMDTPRDLALLEEWGRQQPPPWRFRKPNDP